MKPLPYRSFSSYLSERYGQKVYKLPIKLAGSCPNRDGQRGIGGCFFCGEEGGSFENKPETWTIREQLQKNRETIQKKYNADAFIAYFQNYTNTYLAFDAFTQMISAALEEDIVAIYIATRPDCITEEQLEFLQMVKRENSVDIVVELGLQTANYKTLHRINRGHGLAEYIAGVLRCKKYGIETCAHIILGLPGDEETDVVESAKLLSVLEVEQVKLHALYIVRSSRFGQMYIDGEIEPITQEQFIDWTILFLRTLAPEIVVQRLIGRSPEEVSLFSNWNTSWWLIRDRILDKMEEHGYKQADLCDYLAPKTLDSADK